MEQQLDNKYGYLPKEILTEIFKGLTPEKHTTSKKDLASCLLVCKAWYFAALAFFEEGIRLVIPDETFNKLYNDLHNFPILASKVSHLKLDKFTTGKEKPETLRSIINLCSNLLVLGFATNDVYHYLRVLNCPETEMLKVNKIQVSAMDNASPAVRRFHVWVNYRFRSTITHLEIADVDANGALKNYGGLIKMLEDFPNITHLKAKSVRNGPTINEFNVSTLLKTCPLLEHVKLYFIGHLVFDNDETISTKHDVVTKLKLNTDVVDITALKYINSRFPNVNKLRLIASEVTHIGATFNATESTKIVTDFKTYARSMKRSFIQCLYRDEFIDIDIGGSRPKSFSSRSVFGGMPDELLHELMMMHEDWIDAEEEGIDNFYDIDYIDFLEEQDDQSIADMIMEQHIVDEEEMLFGEQQADIEDDAQSQDYSDGEAERLAFEAKQDYYDEDEAFERFAQEEIEREELERQAWEEGDIMGHSDVEHDELHDIDHSYDEENIHTDMIGCNFGGGGLILAEEFTTYQLDEDDLADQAYFQELHDIHEQELEDAAQNYWDEHDADEEEQMRLAEESIDMYEEQDHLQNLHDMHAENFIAEMEHFDEQEYLDQVEQQIDELEYFEQQGYHEDFHDQDDFHDHFNDHDDFQDHEDFEDEDHFHGHDSFNDEEF
ncbi:unnamed protein product [Mucor hiemalis]